jgi:hypothetical protein
MATAISTCRGARLLAVALLQASLATLVGSACDGGRGHVSTIVDARPAHAAKGQPSIDFDSRAHDFGVVNEGPQVRHVFKIRNKGTAPLVLSGAYASCGCTSATLDATTIPAGGSGALSVVMDTHGEMGKGTRSISVHSDDPTQPEAMLEISYDVQRLLDFERSYLHLSTKRGVRLVETVWLTGELLASARPRVVGIQPGQVVRARVVRSWAHGQPRKGLRIELHDKDAGSGEGAVVIETGLANPPELTLPIRYTVD